MHNDVHRMTPRNPFTLLAAAALAVSLAGSAIAQPVAVDKEGFRLAVPGYEFSFPRDHGSHDDCRTEWWYYTGHLVTASGRRAGFEVTFFRVGAKPPSTPKKSEWDLRHFALAHFAITDIDGRTFRYYEKLNRASRFTASAATGSLAVFNEGWRAYTMPDGAWRLTAAQGGDAIDLVLRSRKPPAVHGIDGVSAKAQGVGDASHYYSMTRLEVTGSVTVKGRAGERCRGRAWMDHEFGSSVLRENQEGWDWFSVQLYDDTELMLYQIRRRDGTPDTTSSGSLVTSDGTVIHIRHDQLKIVPAGKWKSARSGATYPMGWKVSVPTLGVELEIDPVMENQELITTGSTGVTYWEGAVDVQGSSGDVAVKGAGYVEMTGYDRPFTAQ